MWFYNCSRLYDTMQCLSIFLFLSLSMALFLFLSVLSIFFSFISFFLSFSHKNVLLLSVAHFNNIGSMQNNSACIMWCRRKLCEDGIIFTPADTAYWSMFIHIYVHFLNSVLCNSTVWFHMWLTPFELIQWIIISRGILNETRIS